MWNYNYTLESLFSSEIYHHGIKGQRWGIRRYQRPDGSLTPDGKKRYRKDVKNAEQLRRHTAAAKKIIKKSGQMATLDKKDYDEALNNYNKEMRKSSIFESRQKKKVRIDAADVTLSEAEKRLKRSEENLQRDIDNYEAEAKAYTAQIDKMIRSYGSNNIKSISTTTKQIGEGYVKDLIDTGITISDIPIVGQLYSKHYDKIRYKRYTSSKSK